MSKASRYLSIYNFEEKLTEIVDGYALYTQKKYQFSLLFNDIMNFDRVIQTVIKEANRLKDYDNFETPDEKMAAKMAVKIAESSNETQALVIHAFLNVIIPRRKREISLIQKDLADIDKLLGVLIGKVIARQQMCLIVDELMEVL